MTMSQHVEIILDRSGSMATLVEDTVGGINEFTKAQPKGTTFSLTQFDFSTRVELDKTWDQVKRKGAHLTAKDYVPRGMTPLLDAVGSTIQALQGKTKKSDRIVVLIVTDGLENSSRDFTRESVKALIGQAKEDGWQVIFMGADIDAYAESSGLGIAHGQTMGYSGSSTGAAYASAGVSTRSYLGGDTDTLTVDDVE
jgi:Mg-chelatase subunit ChlD